MTARARIAAAALGVLAAAMPAPAHAFDYEYIVLVTGSGTVSPGLDTTTQSRTLEIAGVETGVGNHGFLASNFCVFVVQESGSLAAGSGTAAANCGYVWCGSSVAARTLMTLTLTCAPPSPGSTQTANGTLTCTLTPVNANPVTAVDVLCQGWATRVP